jgi:phospholipid/cholesterol/gamma-HCH transport system substrate-binding protein
LQPHSVEREVPDGHLGGTPQHDALQRYGPQTRVRDDCCCWTTVYYEDWGGPLRRTTLSPLVGLATAVVIGLVFVLAALLFRGSFADTAPVTVLTKRAGLVMNPDAKVKILDVQVGRVASIEALPDGMAAIHLSMDRSALDAIPDNVRVDISSATVFGAKSVQLVSPADPSPGSLAGGAVLTADHVTVEMNTVFQQLTSVLSSIQPEKLNETLGAIATALHGRGEKFGETIRDLNAFLAKLEPSLPNLSHDLETMPAVLETYADAAPDLIKTADNASRISQTIVDEQNDLDSLLVSVIGLGDLGTEVLQQNRTPLADALRLLAPLTDLTNEYREALYCGVAGLLPLALNPALKNPGVEVLTSFLWGQDRWRYPDDLPKVAASGGPQCTYMPRVPYLAKPPWVVTDTGANPWAKGNQGILLNSAGLKEALFGQLPGPPRNSAQIGQPG